MPDKPDILSSGIRCTTAQRHAIGNHIRKAHGAGAITASEMAVRLQAAQDTPDTHSLRKLVRDLPEIPDYAGHDAVRKMTKRRLTALALGEFLLSVNAAAWLTLATMLSGWVQPTALDWAGIVSAVVWLVASIVIGLAASGALEEYGDSRKGLQRAQRTIERV